MTPIRLVFSTVDKFDTAKALARQLVQEKSAACVSIVPNVLSIYIWKERLEETAEWLLIVKTADDRLPALMKRLKELHPYEVPEIISFPIDHAFPAYLDWVVAETRGN